MIVTCEQFVEVLFDFVDGELTIEHREAVEIHISGCPHCQRSAETYRLTVKLTRSLPRCEAPLSPEFEARLRAALSTPRNQTEN